MDFRQLADLLFLLLAGFTALMTVAFYYHWARYASSSTGAVGSMIVYTLGAAALLLGMLGALAGI